MSIKRGAHASELHTYMSCTRDTGRRPEVCFVPGYDSRPVSGSPACLAPRATIVTGQHHQPLRGNETRHALVQTDVGDYGKFKFNTVFVIGRYADQIRSSLQHSGCGQSRRTSRYRAQLATGEVRDMVSELYTGYGSTRCIGERRTTNDESDRVDRGQIQDLPVTVGGFRT